MRQAEQSAQPQPRDCSGRLSPGSGARGLRDLRLLRGRQRRDRCGRRSEARRAGAWNDQRAPNLNVIRRRQTVRLGNHPHRDMVAVGDFGQALPALDRDRLRAASTGAGPPTTGAGPSIRGAQAARAHPSTATSQDADPNRAAGQYELSSSPARPPTRKNLGYLVREGETLCQALVPMPARGLPSNRGSARNEQQASASASMSWKCVGECHVCPLSEAAFPDER